MCIGISAIALEKELDGKRVVFKSGFNSHNEIREKLGISDMISGAQVNLEAHPTGDFSDLAGWKIHVDHGGIPPQWFSDERDFIFDLFRDFYEGEIREIVLTKKYNGYLDLRGTGIIKSKIHKNLLSKCIF